jgi:hypothetical protein
VAILTGSLVMMLQVLFKLDKEGQGEEIERRNLGANEELDFLNWTDNMVSRRTLPPPPPTASP